MSSVIVDLSTAGIQVAFAIETTAGEKPSVFRDIPGPKSIPDLNPEPSSYDTTSLNATEWKTYMEGLKDLGGALGITFGMTQKTLDTWNTDVCAAAKTALGDGKRCWFEFYHPKLDKSFFFTGNPTTLGFPSAEVDQVWDATVNVVPTGEIGWSEAIEPTDAAEIE